MKFNPFSESSGLGRHIITEGQNNSDGTGVDKKNDIYNSMPANTKAKNSILKSYRLPLFILILLFLSFIAFKLIFSKIYREKNQTAGKPKIIKNKIISYKRRFSSSTFDNINRTPANIMDNSKAGKNFNNKFNKEMMTLKKINVQQNKNKDIASYETAINMQKPAIAKKMIVFIKLSYERKVAKEEEGDKKNKMVHYAYKTGIFTPAADKTNENGFTIPIGTVMDAYTKYKIFSYNTEVPVIAILLHSFYRNKKAVLKKGDKFFGMVSIKHSLNRLNMNFNKIIKSDGKSLNIDAIAMTADGSGGVKGNVHHHYTGNILTSAVEGVIGAAALLAGGGSAVNSSNPYTFQDQLRQNVAQNEIGQAQNSINSFSSSMRRTTITLPKDTPIKIIFLRSIHLK